jgi:HSP20 family protein
MNHLQRMTFAPPHNDESFASLDRKRRRIHWDPFLESYLTDVASRLAPTYIPSFDIRESLHTYTLLADLPGVQFEELEIRLQGNRLTIFGERTGAPLGEDETVCCAERTVGTFSRSFNLPDNIDGDQINAVLNNGVLAIQVPKRLFNDQARSRVIPVLKGDAHL